MSDRGKPECTVAPGASASAQRRDGFRVVGPPGQPNVCIRQFGRRYTVINVSIVGMLIEYDDRAEVLPVIDEVWRGCTMEIVRENPITIDLQVRRVGRGGPDGQLGRVGFTFVDIDEDTQRRLQAMILGIQWHHYG
jgi:c-di-GMP-binding flagellar brake protein YcgR